jgi:hypothetical protein
MRQWWNAAFAPAWDVIGVVAFLVGLVLWAWNRYWPDSLTQVAARLGIAQQAAMNDLVWWLPLTCGGAVLMYRLVRAPYELHVASEETAWKEIQKLTNAVDDLTSRLARQDTEHKATIAAIKAQDRGLILTCGRIDFLKSGTDVAVIAVIQNLVNGNTYPVTVQVSLKVPFRVGGTEITFGTVATSSKPPEITDKRPALPPLISLGPKDGVGPGYWVFEFTHKHLTGFLSPYPDKTMDEIFDLVRASEMYIELSDIANTSDPLRIDAPGTVQKRAKRIAKEKAESQ